MGAGEVYSNAPVVLVALEVRHPTAGPLSQAQQRKIKQRLNDVLPILRTGQLANIEGVVGATEPPTVHVEKFSKFFNRDSTISSSIREGAIVVETSRYAGWERLHELAGNVLRARREVGDIDGVERVGLRYINEIRVPGQPNIDWQPWVDTTLLGPAHHGQKLGLPAVQWQGVTVFAPGPDRTAVLRYGPREGYAVDPGGDLKRSAPTPGPFFLMDIDSFWTPSEEVPKFDVDQLVATSDELHAPVRTLFESLITDRLRDEVLRRGE